MSVYFGVELLVYVYVLFLHYVLSTLLVDDELLLLVDVEVHVEVLVYVDIDDYVLVYVVRL